MKTYTQHELFQTLTNYLKQENELIAKAKAKVVEWKYAKEQMFSLFPLSAVLGFRYSSKWEPAPSRWLKEPKEFCCHHGFDADGNVCILKWDNGIAQVFIAHTGFVDEFIVGANRFKRHLFEKGRAVAMYDYCLSPHQYSLEKFNYTGDRLMKSVEQEWYLSEGIWEKGVPTVFQYEYDDVGLLRVVRDMGGHIGKDIMYVRPKSGDLKKAAKPRPLVAYTNSHDIRSDAYGLEMNIDDEWPIDTVILVPPIQIAEVTKETSVTSMGTVYAGASSMPATSELKKMKKAGGKWVLLDAKHKNAADHLAAVVDSGLNVMLLATNEAAVRAAFAKTPIKAGRLVVACRLGKTRSPSAAQAIAAKVRTVLKERGATKCRIVIAAAIQKEVIMDYLAKPDIDGVLNQNGGFEWAMEVLTTISLHNVVQP